MSFFVRGKVTKTKKVKKKNNLKQIEIDDVIKDKLEVAGSFGDEPKSTQEKKVSLAQNTLKELAGDNESSDSDTPINGENGVTDEVISQRLKRHYLEQINKFRETTNFKNIDTSQIHRWKCKDNRDVITAIAVSRDAKFIFSGSKNGVITLYSIVHRNKLKQIAMRQKKDDLKKFTINSLAISYNNKYLAVAQGKYIVIRDGSSLEEIHVFKGHGKPVTSIVFHKDSLSLYSAGADRSVRIWSLEQMVFVETFLGHQSEITSIDALTRQRAITSGGTDCTIRIWKVAEDSQLIYPGHVGSVDCVKFINEDRFVSGGTDGTIQIWELARKKPLCIVENAHGINSENNLPHWIVSVAALVNSDVIASGSYDGVIRLWKLTDSFRTISIMQTFDMIGFVNTLEFTSNGSHLIAAVGREHRFGRWWNIRTAINSAVLIPLSKE